MQDVEANRLASMASIWGYLAASHALLIPSKECPVTDVLDVHYLPGDYSIRGFV